MRRPAVELVILIGLQGSGKSTFCGERFAGTHTQVSRDDLRGSGNPARRQAEMVNSALEARRNVVVDNTNARRTDRATLIEQAKRWGAQVIGYYFEPNVRLSLMRNRSRGESQRVPDVAIFVTKKRLTPPSMDEGFDELYSVRCDAHHDFVVSSLKPR
jgi:predicted kinase